MLQFSTVVPTSYSHSGSRSSSSGLSTGSMVGVIVGVVAAGAALLLGLAFLMRKRIQKRRQFNAALMSSKPSRPFLDHELDDVPAQPAAPSPVSRVDYSASCARLRN